MKICAIIPSRNHYKMLDAIAGRLRQARLPVFIIDDGSDEPARAAIAALHDEARGITVRRFDHNKGKGEAVMEGFRLAMAAGFTHAVQIDADGQHDLEALPRLLQLATAHPDALVSGKPVYDTSIPKSRKIGRWITHVWVWIETLSFRIADSMCGFRVYPLAPVGELMARETIGSRMEFDTEIMVRLFWRGVAPVMLPVKVIYPPDNLSNFNLWRDNWHLTKMHARLAALMLLRLPRLLAHRPPKLASSPHWAAFRERGTWWGLRFCAGIYRLLGREGCRLVMAPVVLYFYASGARQRRASHQFLTRALRHPPSLRESYRSYMNFAMQALDVCIAWQGGIPARDLVPADPAELTAIVADPRGGVFVVAHLGNADMARAVLDKKTRARVTILAHTRHAENYNRVLRRFNPEAALKLLQVTEMGPETVIDLRQRVERGEWIVIAGDRTPIFSRERSVRVPFMGEEATFPQGPWLLGALLECPVYLLLCLRDGKRYTIVMERLAESVRLPREGREEALRSHAAGYAARLEHYALAAPFQWYNFYDFWGSLTMVSSEVTLTAQFYDLDPMGVVWHGHYARFLEQVRCRLLDDIKYNYVEMQASGYIWPIVDMHVKFIRPLRFHQTFTVTATLAEFANRLKIEYAIRDQASGEVLTKAYTVQVAVDAATNELCLESPAVFTDKLKDLI